MRVWDCHSHARGDETGEQVLRAMDAAGVDRLNLFGAYPYSIEGRASGFPRDAMRASIDHIAGIQAADPARIFGLIWADPRTPGMVEEIEYGIVDRGLRGVKMIPDHWYPYDELLFPIYDKMAELGRPMQFHSGILYGFGDSSRFCRPAGFEVLLHWPKLRFSLAHISWPWVDECIAVYGRMRAAGGYDPARCQMWVDTCRGTPDAWREEALRKAVPFCGCERLMFGVDGSPASLADNAPVHRAKDLALLRDVLGLSPAQIEQFFWGAAEAFYQA
jgi:predicted TIM-barrel fold metal-dependent hydrolase